MKRILSLLLVAVMLVGLLPSALAANSSPEPQSLEATELPGVSRLEEQKEKLDRLEEKLDRLLGEAKSSKPDAGEHSGQDEFSRGNE